MFTFVRMYDIIISILIGSIALMKDRCSIDPKYVDVLDGIRAISVIIVLIFHFWQQTWIWPTFATPWLEWLGISEFNYNAWARVGYLFVDMMVLISGFLLFMPVARNILYGEPMQNWRSYYKKRAIRILPSYLLCIVICVIVELKGGGYVNASTGVFDSALFWKDLLSHLTFTQTLDPSTYMSTKLNVVLWTVAIEVWFYLLFPFFAMLAKRWKRDGERACSYAVMRTIGLAIVFVGISHIYIYRFGVNQTGTELSMSINQLPAFFGCYANGMLGALAYTAIAKYVKRNALISIGATIFSVVCIFLIDYLVKGCASSEAAQLYQMTERLKLTLVFTCFILATALAAKWYRWLFSNAFMRYLSAISFNLYIWHQWLAVKLKYAWHIPYWEGDTPPNQLGDKAWMNRYALLITVFAFAAATLVTYFYERPIADLLNKKPSIYNGKIKIAFNNLRSRSKSIKKPNED